MLMRFTTNLDLPLSATLYVWASVYGTALRTPEIVWFKMLSSVFWALYEDFFYVLWDCKKNVA